MKKLKKYVHGFCSWLKAQKKYLKLEKLRQHRHFGLILGICGLVIAFAIGSVLLPSPSSKAKIAALQVITLADNVQNYYRAKPNFWGLETSSALKNGIFPADMNVNGIALNALGKPVFVGSGENGEAVAPGVQGFDVVYKDLSRTHCVFLLSFPFSQEQTLALSQIILNNGVSDSVSFSWGGEPSLLPKPEIAKKYCAKSNTIIWHFE